jgi:cobalt-precorrin 5A hydrolase
MAAGIAVRCVAPLLRDKATDPAVVVLDAAGRFAIPLVGGHLGGANALAREVGRRFGATPVITTATDTAGRPAAEVWARDRGLRVENRAGVVRVNAAWANGEPVGAYLDSALEAEELLASLEPHLAMVTGDEARARLFKGALVVVSHRLLPDLGDALFLRPSRLALGVGCRRGAAPATVAGGVQQALAAAGLAAGAVALVASVDAKAEEPALLELASSLGVPFATFPAETLAAVPVPNPSERVAREVGTASVAEAAALAGAGGGRLILPKVKGSSWTLAVALEKATGEE